MWRTLLIALLAGPAAAEPSLAQVRTQLRALDYKGAAKTLDALGSASGLTHDEVLELYELSGVVAATLKNPKAARAAFQALANLDPSRRLTGRYAPRVTSLFFEARAWAEGAGGLSVVASAALEPGEVGSLTFTVKADVLQRVERVVVHVRRGDGPWSTVELGRTGGTVETAGPRVLWWAELLSARRWVLVSEGSEAAPHQVEAPLPPPPPLPEPEPPMVVAPAPSPALVPTAPVAPPPAPRPRFRPAAFALFGLGVAGLAAGTVFGVLSNGERQRILSAAADGQGVVTGLTRVEALGIDANARLFALVADVCFAAGGALAVTGTALFIAGSVAPDASAAVVTVGGQPVKRGLVLTATAALAVSCTLDGVVDTRRYACSSDSSCGAGFVCRGGVCAEGSGGSGGGAAAGGAGGFAGGGAAGASAGGSAGGLAGGGSAGGLAGGGSAGGGSSGGAGADAGCSQLACLVDTWVHGETIDEVVATSFSDITVVGSQVVDTFTARTRAVPLPDGGLWQVVNARTGLYPYADMAGFAADDVWLWRLSDVVHEENGVLTDMLNLSNQCGFEAASWRGTLAPSRDEAWLVGYRFSICHWSRDAGFQPASPPANFSVADLDLEALVAEPGGELLIGTHLGDLLRVDGGRARPSLPSGFQPVEMRFDSNGALWAIDYAQRVVRGEADGGWSVFNVAPAGTRLYALLVVAPDDVWVGGSMGTLAHFDGGRFTDVRSDVPGLPSSAFAVEALAAPAPKTLIITGTAANSPNPPTGFVSRYLRGP